MKIGILGSGDVAQSLGRGFAKHGHDVLLGTRDLRKLEPWRKSVSGKASVGTFAQAAAHGEVVILALHGTAAVDVLRLVGAAPFQGKLVLDATNPLDFANATLTVGTTDSLGEQVQRALPGAKVVKCFNTVSHIKMIDPAFAEGVPPMLIAGNDADAKKQTESILRGVGWPGVLDVGGIEAARWLEALVPLWVRAGRAMGTWGHAFKVVR